MIPTEETGGRRVSVCLIAFTDHPMHLYISNPKSSRDLPEKVRFKKRALTAIRNAKGLSIDNRSVKLKGMHVWGACQIRIVRVQGCVKRLAKWANLKVIPKVGEEIAIIVKK